MKYSQIAKTTLWYIELFWWSENILFCQSGKIKYSQIKIERYNRVGCCSSQCSNTCGSAVTKVIVLSIVLPDCHHEFMNVASRKQICQVLLCQISSGGRGTYWELKESRSAVGTHHYEFIHWSTNVPACPTGEFTATSSSLSEEQAWPASAFSSSESTKTPASPHSALGPGKPLSICMRYTMPLQHTGFLSMATQFRPTVMAQATIEVPEENQT